MTAPYYDATGVPATDSSLSSSLIRTELGLIETSFDLFPAFSGNGSKVLQVNSGETAVEAVTAITLTGVITGLTLEATGDTASGDNAAIGYTSAEGIIITGQGSTNDITIKNDADTTVISIPTGGTAVTFAGTLSAATGSTVGNLTLANGSITDSSGAISFGNENITTTGTLASGALTVTGLITSGDLTLNAANPEILGGDTDGVMYLAPSTTNALGGVIRLYGDTHATRADDIDFYGSATLQLAYDDSVSSWNFQANAITTTGALTCGSLTSTGIDDNATSTAIKINSSENVGIGTISPETLTHLHGAAIDTLTLTSEGWRASANLLITGADPGNTAGDDGVFIALNPVTGRGGAAAIGAVFSQPIDNKDGGVELAFYGNDGNNTLAERMRIDKAGNVGIGTANPGTKLDVNGTLSATGVITGLTLEATGDTAAGDNSAMGYTAAEGLILTGQGSTNDITLKNDADATVMSVATGGTAIVFAGTISAATASTIGNLTLANGSITDSSGAISFGNENITTTGTFNCGALTSTGIDDNATSVAITIDTSENVVIEAGLILHKKTDSITAGTTQTQAGATALTSDLNRITVSGTDGDGVKLPSAVGGEDILIINDDSAQTVQIWPNTSDAIDGGSADAVDSNTLAAGASRRYAAFDATNWYTT